MSVILIIAAYFALVNIIAFLEMGIDKRRAIKRAYRIPESTLFLTAFVGGVIGSIMGMYYFRHKTRKPVFIYGMPIILLLWIAAIIYIILLPVDFGLL